MMAATVTPQVVLAAMPLAQRAAVARGAPQAVVVRRARVATVAEGAPQAAVVRRAPQAAARGAPQAVVAPRALVGAVQAAPRVAQVCVHARSFAPVPAQIASANAKTEPSFALPSPKRC